MKTKTVKCWVAISGTGNLCLGSLSYQKQNCWLELQSAFSLEGCWKNDLERHGWKIKRAKLVVQL